MSMDGYGDWVDDFMRAVEIDEPALVIGHSFGGGVAIKLAHDAPGSRRLSRAPEFGRAASRIVRSGNGRGGSGGSCSRRGKASTSSRAMRDDLVSNLVHNPLGLVRAGELARSADLRRGARRVARARAAGARTDDAERRRHSPRRVRSTVQRGRNRRPGVGRPSFVAADRSRFVRRRAGQRRRGPRERTSGQRRDQSREPGGGSTRGNAQFPRAARASGSGTHRRSGS